MKYRLIIGIFFLILFSTFISQKKNSFNQFKVKEIIIENETKTKAKELIKELSFLYNENIIFLNSYEIKKKLGQESFIKSLKVKKIYPSKLLIKITEKKPIAILIHKQEKYFVGKNLKLIKYKDFPKLDDLPIIKGDHKKFKTLFVNLKKVNFPIKIIKKYNFYETNRWDLEIIDKKIIKLPVTNYKESLKNFLEIKTNKNFEKYIIFDYRLDNQLILK